MRGVFAALSVPVVCPALMCATWSLWKEVAHQEGKCSSERPRPSGNSPGQPPHTPWCQHTIRIYPRKGGGVWGGSMGERARMYSKFSANHRHSDQFQSGICRISARICFDPSATSPMQKVGANMCPSSLVLSGEFDTRIVRVKHS